MSNSIFFLVCSLLTAAFLWPSEGAIHGSGLYLAVAWLLVGGLVLSQSRPFAAMASLRAWLPVPMLLVGFWVSTWHVFAIHGDRRSALNLAFEWSAIGMAWWLVRQMNATRVRLLLLLIAGLAVGVSVFGIVQYHVSNQKQAEWYLAKRVALGTANPTARVAIESDLQRAGIPSDGASRELFERRLLSSSEPVGPFALANTLGGVLSVAFVLLMAGVLHEVDVRDRTGILFWFSCLLLMAIVGYCLVLTKSRTAWVGSLAGIMFLFSLRIGSLRLWLQRATLVGLAVGIAAVVGVVSGAVDREVVMESPKSLQYRLFYWMGAAGVIAESPVYGAGPGNFRQSYLAYKVPGSSEEILDPHNIFVDAWCSAGVTGFLSIVLMTIGVVWQGRRVTALAADSSSQNSADPSSFGRHAAETKLLSGNSAIASGLTLIKAVMAGAGLVLIWRWVNGGVLWDTGSDFFLSENQILIVPVAASIGVLMLCCSVRIPAKAARPACVCLLVHLLGAGGLQISICGMLLLVLHAISLQDDDSLVENQVNSAWLRRTALAGVLIMLFGIIYSGLVPVVQSEHYRQVAAARASFGDENAAGAAYRDAIASDSLSVDSRQQNAEFLAYSFLTALGQYAPAKGVSGLTPALEKQYAACMKACAELIDADRRGVRGYLIRGQIQQAKGSVCSGTSELQNAVSDLTHVLDIYPTNAKVWAELALLCQMNGNTVGSQAAAKRALEQEKINRDWGHADRYLNADVVKRLRRVSSGVTDSR